MMLHRRLLLIAAAAFVLTACANRPSLEQAPPIVFVHGNGDTAALWQTTSWRFESNGWPRERLYAINLPYPLARDDDSKPQLGRTSTAEHMAYLGREIDKVLQATGARQVVLMGNSRGGNAIRNYIETEFRRGGVESLKVSHAILGGTPNHGVWAIKGFREGNEFSGTGPFLTALNAPRNAKGELLPAGSEGLEVTPGVKWLTIRSDSNDKFAQPDGLWIGAKGKPTYVSFAGPELKGATNVVIPRIDHRETSFSPAAFEASYRFITGKPAATTDISREATVRLDGTVTGLGVQSADPASGNFRNNLPMPGAELQVFAIDATSGQRIGAPVHQRKVGSNGLWGPFMAKPDTPYEFVVSAPGYATTHIYRSAFPRSSDLVQLQLERMADADLDAGALVTLTRPRGYFDRERDTIRLDGQLPPGVPASGAGVASSKLKLTKPELRTITAEFNGERLSGQTWPAADKHVVVLEITQ